MATPRRRLVRPVSPPATPRPQAERQAQRLRSRLEAKRRALGRWLPRQKRACNAVFKTQQRIARLERQLAQHEE
jgi:hypothetical protein